MGIVIAIDGHSSTGKSTLAKDLARALEYRYIDSGAMYRAITLYAIRNGLIQNSELNISGLIKALPEIHLEFQINADSGISEIHLNGENVEKSIRTLEVSSQVSPVSAIAEVRAKLVASQQELGRAKGIVMDGRDIGTVVFPEAELKVFMTASAEVRAARRYKELLDRGENVSYERVLENVQKRDHIDSTREVSPLKIAEKAVVIDNSDMGQEEQFERVFSLAQRTIANKKGA